MDKNKQKFLGDDDQSLLQHNGAKNIIPQQTEKNTAVQNCMDNPPTTPLNSEHPTLSQRDLYSCLQNICGVIAGT
eukprot:gene3490-6121_t